MAWFFTYGLSTDLDQMAKDVGHWQRYEKATLNDYVYTFTGCHPEFKAGTSTLLPVRGGVVLGVAYLLDDQQIQDMVEHGHGYSLKDNQVVINGENVTAHTLQPAEIGAPNPPSDDYLNRVRSGLSRHYPAQVVDVYLKRALKRAGRQEALPWKTPTPDSFKREYGVSLRRLFPWDVTESSAFGSAWTVVSPGEETEPQAHDEEETFIIISGEGLMNLDGNEFTVKKGDTVYVEPFSAHTVRNDTSEPLEVLCVWWGGYVQA